MGNEKKRLYITILEEDLNLLIQEANTLGISKSNYAFLILYLFKDISLSTEEIEKYTEKVNNKEGKIASFYLTLSPYMSKIHANKGRDIFSINQYIATIIHSYLKTSKVPRSTEKGKFIRRRITVPMHIVKRFDEIFEKTTIYSKTLINYELVMSEFEYKNVKKRTKYDEVIYLQYPVWLDNLMPEQKEKRVALLEQILNKYTDI